MGANLSVARGRVLLSDSGLLTLLDALSPRGITMARISSLGYGQKDADIGGVDPQTFGV